MVSYLQLDFPKFRLGIWFIWEVMHERVCVCIWLCFCISASQPPEPCDTCVNLVRCVQFLCMGWISKRISNQTRHCEREMLLLHMQTKSTTLLQPCCGAFFDRLVCVCACMRSCVAFGNVSASQHCCGVNRVILTSARYGFVFAIGFP